MSAKILCIDYIKCLMLDDFLTFYNRLKIYRYKRLFIDDLLRDFYALYNSLLYKILDIY